VLTLAEQGKTAEEINAKIPPYDLNWTISILNDALNHDWVERMDTDSELSQPLADFPDAVKEDAWRRFRQKASESTSRRLS
jgi:hypothetical protein